MLAAYFETGGMARPKTADQLESAMEKTLNALSATNVVTLGGVCANVRQQTLSPQMVPYAGAFSKDETPIGLGSQSSLGTLRWLMMQIELGQDALLLADPGPRPRRLVEWLCSLLGREAEWVGITRDTTESDLKQRREMRRGTIRHEPAPPLRAALHGRVLILDGVEKAERNVLPLLNNLLENREMALDDGTFLAAPQDSDCDHRIARSDDGAGDVLTCSQDFIVVAIGLPQPTYHGSPLDPPLRSRFACRRLVHDAAEDAFAYMRKEFPRLPPATAKALVLCCESLRMRSATGDRRVAGGANGLTEGRTVGLRRLPFVSEAALRAAAAALAALPRLSPHAAFHRAFPYDSIGLPRADVDRLSQEISRMLPEPSTQRSVGYGIRNVEPFARVEDGSKRDVKEIDMVDKEVEGLRHGCTRRASVCLCATNRTTDEPAADIRLTVSCGGAPLWRPADEQVPVGAATAGQTTSQDACDSCKSSKEGDNGASVQAAREDEVEEVDALSVGKLKALLAQLEVDTAGLLEKADMRNAAKAAIRQRRVAGSAKGDGATGSGGNGSVSSSLGVHGTDGGDGGRRTCGVGLHVGDVPPDWRRWCGPGAPLCDSQLHALGELMWMHALERDVCLLAHHGAGKTTICRRFASLLGYTPHVVFCHQEMASHELLQRRATDASGDTVWVDSPLVVAATCGELAILDGMHRLAPGTLAGALAPLLTERCMLSLPDGSRLVSHDHWHHLLTAVPGMTPQELLRLRVRRVHPCFRVIACAELPTSRHAWLSDELLALFTFIPLQNLCAAEQRQLVGAQNRAHCTSYHGSCRCGVSSGLRALLSPPLPPPFTRLPASHCCLPSRTPATHKCSAAARPALETLLRYEGLVRAAAEGEPALRVAQPSNRQLLRASRHLIARPFDTSGALRRSLAAAMLALPPAARATALSMLATAARIEGVPADVMRALAADGGDSGEGSADVAGLGDGLRSGKTARLVAEAKARAEAEEKERRAIELKDLEKQAIELRMADEFGGGASPHLRAAVDSGARKMAEARKAEALRNLSRRNDEARRAVEASGSEADGTGDGIDAEAGDLVTIGDVSVPVRRGGQRSLIPNPPFVPIAGHIRLLHELLVDWSLGHHLLLLGEQGVGKNKLADKLLSLLRAEREYVQLHRDTTVASLTLRPVLEAGTMRHEDSGLVRACRLGRVLVVDEADKAPLEVVCVLKALAEDGELVLGDGRRLVAADRNRSPSGPQTTNDIPIHSGFRMIVLANPPGYPFQGNDFYRECGDVFAAHAVRNVDTASQAQLLRKVAPDIDDTAMVTLLSLFGQLKLLHEQGVLGYPYSVRELVLVAKRLQAFPDDGLSGALRDVFDFDAEDASSAATIADVLAAHGLAALAKAVRSGTAVGDMNLSFETRSTRLGRDQMGESHKPPPMPDKGPRHGDWDGKQHMGGNRYAGGSGGTGTAGLGGRAGPYRLDVGQDVHMLNEDEKGGVEQSALDAAKRMADEAYAARLQELGLAAHDAAEYDSYLSAVQPQVFRMRRLLREHQTRAEERVWHKGRPTGELDEARLADGLAGATSIYKHRGPPPPTAIGGQRRVSIRFVMDLSGSMYTFDRIDRRKTRLLETAFFFMQSLDGLENEYEYSMVGHSGSGPEAEQLIHWGEPPLGAKTRLQLLQRMALHTQYCYPGDQTYEATSLAIKNAAARQADERFVFVISDADLARYGKRPEEWNEILSADPSVKAYAVLIGNAEQEADRISAALDAGKGYMCTDTSELANTFERIFQASVAVA